MHPQMYAKTLNNLATMYFRLGEGVITIAIYHLELLF